jgi:hypothetical protein
MLDILILIFLCIRIRKIVEAKGYNKVSWTVRTVVVWIVFEMIGMTISLLLQKDILIVLLSGILCAIGGYLIIQNLALRLPDQKNSSSGNLDY